MSVTIEKQITDYLVHLNTKQKKAVLTVAKTFAEEQDADNNIWNDKNFVAEIERRTAEMESGKVKGITWEEVKKSAKQLVKNKNIK